MRKFAQGVDWIKVTATLIVGIIMVSQAYFLYLSSKVETGRNLLIIEKAPMRIIARWDNVDGEVENVELEKEFIKERINWVTIMSGADFIDYRFNENLNVNIRTETVKGDSNDISINETETLTNGH